MTLTRRNEVAVNAVNRVNGHDSLRAGGGGSEPLDTPKEEGEGSADLPTLLLRGP